MANLWKIILPSGHTDGKIKTLEKLDTLILPMLSQGISEQDKKVLVYEIAYLGQLMLNLH